jgi:RPA family protein|tara:strand:- start:4706 stop:5359 length:654 start_codon:yes stop_codon:yes gene_type:complete
MTDEQFKRNIAFKFRIGDILSGNPIINNERFSFLELENKRVIRVNVVGSIVDKYENEGEKNYSFLTLDDGSGQIKLKSFGDEIEKVKNVSHGQTVIVIGSLRYFNNEIYISPEIIKEQDPKYLVLRKIELEKQKQELGGESNLSEAKISNGDQTSEKNLRDKIIELIKNSESEGGIDTEKLISSLGESQETINQEVQKLLEEGIIFEPRPGKIRWLG